MYPDMNQNNQLAADANYKVRICNFGNNKLKFNLDHQSLNTSDTMRLNLVRSVACGSTEERMSYRCELDLVADSF